jgi:hypothetical protein
MLMLMTWLLAGAATATLPGQDAFGAIQEIMAILEADPATDWSRVDVAALREHLVDMDELTVRADVRTEKVEQGVRFRVAGQGRTREAIRRMVPAHARMLDGFRGWKTGVETSETGVVLTVTAGDAEQRARLQALGFFGVMASGAHHQEHHLAIARGHDPHRGHPHH